MTPNWSLPLILVLVLCISSISSSSSSSSSSSFSSSYFSSNSTSPPIRNVRFIKAIEASENITNYLFRGSLPQLDNKTFAYSELIESMNIALYSSSPPSSLPSSFKLVIVCLLNDLQEYSQIQVEKDFFEAHPELGSFIHWPIYGSALNPEDFDSTLRDYMAKGLETWSHDKLPSGMESLQSSLEYPEDLPSVYYIHCDAGMDRTGEVSGAYYLHYMDWTYSQAIYYDDHEVENRDIHTWSRNELDWYCYYLQVSNQLPQGGGCANATASPFVSSPLF